MAVAFTAHHTSAPGCERRARPRPAGVTSATSANGSSKCTRTRSGAWSMSVTTARQQLRTLPCGLGGEERHRVRDRPPRSRARSRSMRPGARRRRRARTGRRRRAGPRAGSRRGARRRTASAGGAGPRRGSDLHDAAAVDHDDAVGERERLERVVGHERRARRRRSRAARGASRRTSTRVCASSAASGSSSSSARGSTASARARARRAAPARRRARAAWRAARPRDPSRAEQLAARARWPRPCACPARARPERDVVERVEVAEQQAVLEHQADRALLGRDEHAGGGVVEHHAVEPDRARVDRHQARDQRRSSERLARAVGPDEHDELVGARRRSSTSRWSVPSLQLDVARRAPAASPAVSSARSRADRARAEARGGRRARAP